MCWCGPSSKRRSLRDGCEAIRKREERKRQRREEMEMEERKSKAYKEVKKKQHSKCKMDDSGQRFLGAAAVSTYSLLTGNFPLNGSLDTLRWLTQLSPKRMLCPRTQDTITWRSKYGLVLYSWVQRATTANTAGERLQPANIECSHVQEPRQHMEVAKRTLNKHCKAQQYRYLKMKTRSANTDFIFWNKVHKTTESRCHNNKMYNYEMVFNPNKLRQSV